MCVYGLLTSKDAPRIAAPSKVTPTVVGRQLTLTWAAEPGARVYRVYRKSTLEPAPKVIAMGLATPSYTEPAPERGETTSYYVEAVAADGRVSPMSAPVMASSPKPKKMDD